MAALPTQIPQDHSHKQLLIDLPSPALTASWSPPSPLLHASLLATGHAQGVSVYRQHPRHAHDTDSHTLDRAEAFRIRWTLEHVCDGTLGLAVTKIAWAPTSAFNPASDSNAITLLALSTDHAARIIEFPSEGGTQLSVLGGTSGHRSFINDIDSIIHPRTTTVPTNHDLVIATAGDDNTLIVWQWDGNDESGQVLIPAAYTLSSPGVATQFCRHFPRRLIVAEEEGTIRLLDWAAGDEARVSSSSGWGSGSTLWLLNIHMGVGLSFGPGGLLANVEWCGDDVEGGGGRICGVSRGGEWAVWDLSRIEGGGRTVPIEQGQIIHANNVLAIRSLPPDERELTGSSHPSDPTLFAIASKATHETPPLHIVDLALEQQTYPHPIHSLPTSTITPTSLSWHPTEAILATTLSSGTLLLTRTNDRSDGEKQDIPDSPIPALHIPNGHIPLTAYEPAEYDEYDESFISRGEEMSVDEQI